MQTIRAKWFHSGRLKPVRLIVVHCTVSPESGTGAEAVARYFQSGTRRASTHRVSDNNSTVLCVADGDTAFGAAGANSDGLHLELVGMPDQSSEAWRDDYSTAEVREAGSTIREWSREYDVPLRWLTVAQVADGKTKGLCTHHDVSRAFPDVSTGHWDPGPNFPKQWALNIWTPKPVPDPVEDDDVRTLVKGNDSPEWWITDGLTKRHVKDRTEARSLVYFGLARFNNDTGEAFEVEQWFVDRLVTVTDG